MTYPLIGNYGINRRDVESKHPHVAGFIIKELSPIYSNYRADLSLDEYLKQNNVIGIQGIDTRSLVRKLRITGAMRGILSTEIFDDAALVEKARHSAKMAGADWVKAVMPDKEYDWSEDQGEWGLGKVERGDGLHVVALDCGAKTNILRHLAERGIKVTVLPGNATAEEILKHRPDGLFVSNGPGDPAVLDYAVKPIKGVMDQIPTFGICLGHQLLGRAIGAETYKLKFGHRGGNQPVMNLETGRVEITSQNHGFAVDQKSLEKSGGVVTHVNLNDQTVEGFRHKTLPVFFRAIPSRSQPRPARRGLSFRCICRNDEDKKSADGEAIRGIAGAAGLNGLRNKWCPFAKRKRQIYGIGKSLNVTGTVTDLELVATFHVSFIGSPTTAFCGRIPPMTGKPAREKTAVKPKSSFSRLPRHGDA